MRCARHAVPLQNVPCCKPACHTPRRTRTASAAAASATTPEPLDQVCLTAGSHPGIRTYEAHRCVHLCLVDACPNSLQPTHPHITQTPSLPVPLPLPLSLCLSSPPSLPSPLHARPARCPPPRPNRCQTCRTTLSTTLARAAATAATAPPPAGARWSACARSRTTSGWRSARRGGSRVSGARGGPLLGGGGLNGGLSALVCVSRQAGLVFVAATPRLVFGWDPRAALTWPLLPPPNLPPPPSLH